MPGTRLGLDGSSAFLEVGGRCRPASSLLEDGKSAECRGDVKLNLLGIHPLWWNFDNYHDAMNVALSENTDS